MSRPKPRKTSLNFLQAYSSMKTLSLVHLTANQHLLMAICRDFSLILPIVNIFRSCKKSYDLVISNSNIEFPNIYDSQSSISETIALLWQSYINNNHGKLSHPSVQEQGLLSYLAKPDASEYFLSAVWCVVALYLTYSILDSLMVRWIVKYSTVAAIVRMFSMSVLLVTVELTLLSSFSPQNDYFLHTWILISCILTAVYIWQSYLTSNLNYMNQQQEVSQHSHSVERENEELHNHYIADTTDTESENNDTNNIINTSKEENHEQLQPFYFTDKRTIDLYKITVFCVVPVGLASFMTMIGLLRNLFIHRLDVEQVSLMLQNSYRTE